MVSAHHSEHDNLPSLSALVAEVDQSRNVEEKLDKVVQHQQDQTQTVETEIHMIPLY